MTVEYTAVINDPVLESCAVLEAKNEFLRNNEFLWHDWMEFNTHIEYRERSHLFYDMIRVLNTDYVAGVNDRGFYCVKQVSIRMSYVVS